MARRIAVASALIVFALCLVQGIEADNGFTTTVSRALTALFGTLVVGLLVGAMAQRMMDEQKKSADRAAAGTDAGAAPAPAGAEKSRIGRTKIAGDDR